MVTMGDKNPRAVEVLNARLQAAAALESLEDMRRVFAEAMLTLQHAGRLIPRPHHANDCHCLPCSWWHDYLALHAAIG